MPNYDARRIALFRYQVIAPLISVSGPRGTLRREMKRVAERHHDHPYRGLTRFSLATIEEWHYQYKRSGLDGLLPAPRLDRGRSRVINDALAERIERLAASRPELDGRGLLMELKCSVDSGTTLPSPSSLYRFLRSRGLDQRRAPNRQDHRKYAFDLAGDCWQGDVMYGPSVPARDGTRRKTYLIALIDDATRVIPHAQFYFEQHLRSLKDCLKQALLKRGVPRRLYLDNGQIFRSRMLLGVCARLAIELIHSRPYKPQGRAKIERFFGTVRRGFVARVDIERLADLHALNRLLFAWVEGQYHVKPHRGIDGETPLDRWLRSADGMRPLPRDVDLEELFLEQATRRVAKDGTFSLKGKSFEAGPAFIGRRVTVRFDPFDLRRVLFSDSDSDREVAYPVDLAGNRRVRRNPPPVPEDNGPPADLRSLQDLADRMDDDANNPDNEQENTDE